MKMSLSEIEKRLEEIRKEEAELLEIKAQSEKSKEKIVEDFCKKVAKLEWEYGIEMVAEDGGGIVLHFDEDKDSNKHYSWIG